MKTDYGTGGLEEYLAGELKEGDLWEFRRRLNSDNTLRKEIVLHQEIYEAIRDETKWEIRNTIEQIKEHATKSRRLTIYSWKTQVVAATIVLFIMVGSLFTSDFFDNASPNKSMYDTYFSTENTILTVRSHGMVNLQFIDEGLEYFNDGDFENAIHTLNQDPSNMLAKLYVGFSYMKLEEFGKAEDEFRLIIDDDNNLFVDQAEWNLGLCYMVSNQTDLATTVFQKIAGGNTSYKEQANELLLKIGNK